MQLDQRGVAADPAPPTAGPPPPPGRLTPGQRTAVGLGVVSLLFLLVLRGQLRNQGPPMEEGFMLVFPELVLEGKLPNRDFLHLYGPGSLWVLAAVFEVFGVSLAAERIVGLLQQVGLAFGVFALARYWGRTLATWCGVVAALIIIPPIGLTALAWVGAVAFGLGGLLCGLEARRRSGTTAARRFAVAAGVLFGFALLYRPDLVVAVGLGGAALAWGLPQVLVRRMVLGFVAGVSPYLVHVATAGLEASVRGMLLDPVFYLRGGRRLPVPPNPDHYDGFLQKAGDIDAIAWPIPSLRGPAQLTLWFFLLLAVVAFLVVLGAVLVRRQPESFTARALLAVALFSAGLLPQGLQRVDSTHFAWVSAVPFGFLPVAVHHVLRSRLAGVRMWTRGLVAGGIVVTAIVLLIPHFTARTYVDYVLRTFDIYRLAYPIAHNGRLFYYGRPDVPRALEPLLEDASRITEPGDTLFVGTSDLRFTPYADSFIYFLLPELEPSTYYIEMDPGVANREGSRLADDVAAADIVVLSAVWDDWDEPNDSRVVGSDAPNEILREQFCEVGSYGGGLFRLLERCDRR